MNWKAIRYLIVIIFVTNNTFAQNTEYEGQRHYIYTSHAGFTEKAQVLTAKSFSIPTNREVYYYWYMAGNILSTQGGYNGNILDGIYIASYLNDNLKEKGLYEKGAKVGQWISWFENGKISTITNWNKGLLSGEERKYNDLGVLYENNTYKDGKLNGVSIIYRDSVVVSKKYKNGQEVIKKVKPVKVKDPSKTKTKVKEAKPYDPKKITNIKKAETKPKTSLKVKWNKAKLKIKTFFKKKAK